MSLRFIQIFVCHISFLYIAEYFTDVPQFINTPIEAHLDCFQFLKINGVVKHICVQIFCVNMFLSF